MSRINKTRYILYDIVTRKYFDLEIGYYTNSFNNATLFKYLKKAKAWRDILKEPNLKILNQ